LFQAVAPSMGKLRGQYNTPLLQAVAASRGSCDADVRISRAGLDETR
jgi:hypothetical protein